MDENAHHFGFTAITAIPPSGPPSFLDFLDFKLYSLSLGFAVSKQRLGRRIVDWRWRLGVGRFRVSFALCGMGTFTPNAADDDICAS